MMGHLLRAEGPAAHSRQHCRVFTPSPRVRGKRAQFSMSILSFRYIPACAGEAHPGPLAEIRTAGTSPRVRGKRQRGGRHAPDGGYIPACAGEAARSPAACTGSRVHPRVCGGSRWARILTRLLKGTSPRVRGKPGRLESERADGRYIPACAGEAGHATVSGESDKVHPRVCGGSRCAPQITHGERGTSPRVRGKHDQKIPGAVARGYIPACAGEAPRPTASRDRTEVHPRVCGGSRYCDAMLARWKGTSPRVRGKGVHGVLGQGYIPACAGEAAAARVTARTNWVHPRVCGGSLGASRSASRSWGTSPRVRGKRAMLRFPANPIRYIPACAGEAAALPKSLTVSEVHPRVCGGSRYCDAMLARWKGTSPRVRGKGVHGVLGQGYIPACAGEAAAARVTARTNWVHPRVCGGSLGASRSASRSWGTSPRVRGKLIHGLVPLREVRYIPACAGEAAAPPRPGAPQ